MLPIATQLIAFWLSAKAGASFPPESLPSSRELRFNPEKLVVLVGKNVEMSCQLQSSLNFVWYHLARSSDTYKTVSLGATLVMNSAKLEDSGDYKCIAFNPNGNQSNLTTNVDLQVLEKISFLSVVAHPSDLFVFEGYTITLTCQATTWPPIITWSWYKSTEEGSSMVGLGKELSLYRVEESGVYYCRANSTVLTIIQDEYSGNKTIHIIPKPAEMILALAAVILVLLSLLFFVPVVFWLWRQQRQATVNTPASNVKQKGIKMPFPEPAKAPKWWWQQERKKRTRQTATKMRSSYSSGTILSKDMRAAV
ncbi:high affinity immunoglobulin epsilon receptor subunit alpha-like isoform X2 [Lepisosteus oculatus]|uniref:high affinity immunoglobulin epsilon receptor subunit alpha-like isoform X2 n=1 Tax=Lepisosteus oculatus TaxID=7918 RepID=UPI0007405571|nr:PREDICTED: basigin-like isoform X2 [Lepisosteus oculatus]